MVGSRKPDNRLSQNVLDIRRSYKVYRKYHGKLAARGKSLTEVKIQRGVFLRDVLSKLMFVISMIPFNYILRKCKGGYQLHKSQENINHLM